MTKIADFFVNVAVKGDVKQLKQLLKIKQQIDKQTKSEEKTENKKEEKQTKSNNTQLKQKKEIVKKEKTINDMFAKFITKNAKVAKSIDTQLLGGASKFLGTLSASTLAVVGMGLAFAKVVQQISSATNELTKLNQIYTNFQRQTGMGLSRTLGVSSAMADIDVTMSPEDVMKSMEQAQQNITSLSVFGEGNAIPYAMLGINYFNQNADVMFDQMRKRLKEYPPALRSMLLQQAGFDPRLGALADMSDAEYAARKAERADLFITPEQREEIQELASEYHKMELRLQKIKDLWTLILGKMIKPIVQWTNKWLIILTRISEKINNAVTSFQNITDTMKDLPAILWAISTLIVTAFNPILGLIMFLYPLFEDLMVWAAGGDSFFKELFTNPDMVFGFFFDKLTMVLDNALKGLEETLKKGLGISSNPSPSRQNNISTVVNMGMALPGNPIPLAWELGKTVTNSVTNAILNSGAKL